MSEKASFGHSESFANLITLARGTSLNGLGYVSRTLLLYLYSFLLARLLGAEGLGLYALAASLVLLAAQIGELGMRGGVMRFVGAALAKGDRTRAAAVLRLALILTLLASGALASFTWLAAERIAVDVFAKPELALLLKILVPATVFLALGNVLAAFTQAFRVMKYKVLVQDLVQLVLQIVLAVLLIYAGLGVAGSVLAYVIAALIALILLAVFANRLVPWQVRGRSPHLSSSELLHFSFPIFLANILGILSARANLLLLGMALDSRQVGIFDLVFQISLAGKFFLSSFNMVFAPMVADLASRGHFDELEELYHTATRWLITLALPVFLALAILATPLLSIFGPEFVLGSGALIVLAGAQLINVGVGSVGYLLAMSGHPRPASLNSAIGLALTVGLNLWLVPRWGLIGAAVAQGVMLATVNILGLAEVRWILKLHPYSKSYRKPLLAGAVATAVTCLALQLVISLDIAANAHHLIRFVVGIFSLLASYSVALLAQGLEAEDREMVTVFARRLKRSMS